MVKHIFCDLDGTLYHNGISKEDIESIKRIEKRGVKFHIATGRTFNDAHSMINDSIKLDGYYICENGAFIHDKNHKLLFKGTIEDEIVNSEEENMNVGEETTQSKEENKKEDNYTYEEYLGVVDIPKISLYKGFYNKDSKLNNVKFNLYVLPESIYPDIDKGNLIIAGHSGNYNNSYFANLYKLENGDTITIHYNNSKYIYEIVNIYYEKKTGSVRIFRNKEKTTLTLITCTKDDKYHQTIYIAELTEIE